MSSPYDPNDWYWVVGANSTQVYSSKASAYVPVTDPKYLVWLTLDGNVPTRIGSEQELWDYLNAKAPGSTGASATSTDAAKSGRVRDQMSEVVGLLLMDHENRLRAKEGLPPMTQNQFVQHVKALMK